MPIIGQLRVSPEDSNVFERWNHSEWVFYCWVDLAKAKAL